MITDRDRRGAQLFALDLAVGLERLGLAVDTFALGPGRHRDPLPVQALGPRRLGLRTLWALRRLVSRYDVVVAHGSTTLPASVLALIGMKIPIVYRQISDPTFWASSWSRRLRVAALLRRMRAVVTLSAEGSVVLKRHYRLRARPAVTVIPNAVSEERFRPPVGQQRAQARATLGVPADADVILVIGALVPEKGVDLAITASAELPGAVLLIVGEGPERPELQALASRRLAHRCFFAGSLDDPRLAYWSADLLLFPSLSESMPAVLIEAGLCGLATVAADVGATREVIDDGATGLVVPVGDSEAIASAVRTLIGDPSRRTAMGHAATIHCSDRFTITRTAPAWRDLLEDVCRPRHDG